MKCQTCKYHQSGICVVPLWVEGQLYGGRVTEPEKTCDLFESSETLMAVVGTSGDGRCGAADPAA